MGRVGSVLMVAALLLLTGLTVAQQSVPHVAVHAGNVLDVSRGKLLPNQRCRPTRKGSISRTPLFCPDSLTPTLTLPPTPSSGMTAWRFPCRAKP